MKYLTDGKRHLICVPYTHSNLHKMADDLGIHRCWFHDKEKFPHYDIPKRRIEEIESQCTKLNRRAFWDALKGFEYE